MLNYYLGTDLSRHSGLQPYVSIPFRLGHLRSYIIEPAYWTYFLRRPTQERKKLAHMAAANTQDVLARLTKAWEKRVAENPDEKRLSMEGTLEPRP